MKKYRIISVVLATINLMLAWYLAVEFEFLLGFNYPVGLTQVQRNTIIHAIIYDSFIKLLVMMSIAAFVSMIIKRDWGRILALIQCVMFVVFSAYVLVGVIYMNKTIWLYFPFAVLSDRYFIVGICILYSVSVWIYLTRPNIKAIFRPIPRPNSVL